MFFFENVFLLTYSWLSSKNNGVKLPFASLMGRFRLCRSTHFFFFFFHRFIWFYSTSFGIWFDPFLHVAFRQHEWHPVMNKADTFAWLSGQNYITRKAILNSIKTA